MRRICCFCEKWESGGIESFLTTVLLHLDSSVEVDITANCIEESVFTQRLKSIGVRFIQLSGKLRCAKNSKMFRALLRERHYDVVHFNLFQGLSLYYVQIAKQEGVPVRIAHSHGAGLRKSAARPLKLMLHAAGRAIWSSAATDFWACSRNAANFLFPASICEKNRVQIVPNLIDVEKFRFSDEKRERIRKELKISERTVLIGTVGRLSSEKNHSFLLDIFLNVHIKRPDSRLIFVGEGDCIDDLHTKVQTMGLDKAVIFYGTTEQVDALLAAMDVFVFPSQIEGFGIAAVEAQAAGLPVVCSDRIPQEAQVTTDCYSLPLACGVETWAKTILSSLTVDNRRCKGADRVRQAGFDVKDVVRLIEGRFL